MSDKCPLQPQLPYSQLPYPQFPPLSYPGGHRFFNQCGLSGCTRETVCSASPDPTLPEPRFTEIEFSLSRSSSARRTISLSGLVRTAEHSPVSGAPVPHFPLPVAVKTEPTSVLKTRPVKQARSRPTAESETNLVQIDGHFCQTEEELTQTGIRAEVDV